MKINEERLKWMKFLAIAVLLMYTVIKGVIPGWSEIKTDFPNYYVSAKSVVEGEDLKKLYNNQWFQAKIYEHQIDAWGKFSPQPPLTALLMTPIASLSPMAAKRTWLCLNLLFLCVSIILIREIFQLSWTSSILAMLLMGRALANDLNYGQIYVFITVMILLSIWLVKKYNFQMIAGTILAIAMWLKYFPVVFILYALFNRQFKLVVASAATVVVLLLAQFYFFGTEVNQFYFLEILPAHLSGNIPGQGGYAISYQSWPSLLNNLFVYDEVNNPNPVLGWATGKWISLTLIYLVTTGFLLQLIVKKFSSEEKKSEIVLILLIISGLALLPATARYHFMFLLIPVCLLLRKEINLPVVSMIFLIFAINIFPYPFADNGSFLMLLLSYPRLLALNLLLLLIYTTQTRIKWETH
ncbi:MAG: glycosyltransferase family 87 protein [Bacteroidota bacterium]